MSGFQRNNTRSAPFFKKVLSAAIAFLLVLQHLLLLTPQIAKADNIAQALPFSQNWANTALISTDDNWSSVPGITGFRGDGLVSSTGVNPQTVLGESAVVDVNANRTDPNTFITGGVAEFELADPVVALQGSGTARAPYVQISFSTLGRSGINVAYNIRDIDGSADNAIQPVALQFRVGSTGNFTNVPAGFVADATTGPNQATLVTPVSAALPTAVENQSLVQVRMITTDAAGSDEWVGIDDISITSGGITPTPTPTATPTPPPTPTPTPGPTNPTATGSANPSAVTQGGSTLLTVNVSPGANQASTGIMVTGDLTAIGGPANQQFIDNGNNIFTFQATVSANTTGGPKLILITATDAESRTGTTNLALNVVQPPDHLVISQVYGGGGNANATFQNDFVEIHNPTASPVDTAGWTLQYASSTGTSSALNTQPLGGIVGPGEYYLVGLATNGAVGLPLPQPNVSGSINMSGTTGKIALVSNGGLLAGNCPLSDPDLVDYVGYGSSPNCSEGLSPAPAPSNTTALFRKFDGAQDTNVNGSDFATGTPNPRRTTAIQEIGPAVLNTDTGFDDSKAPKDASPSVTFTEPVMVDPDWFDISCASGHHNDATLASANGGRTWEITPNTNFTPGEQCTVTVKKDAVHDVDTDDSGPNTDTLPADYSWSFTVATMDQMVPFSADIHMVMGNPSNAFTDINQPNNYLMQRAGNALSYNRDKGTPNWVSWHLDKQWYGTLTRFDTFRPDPQVPADWYRVTDFDYSLSGFDRGHMTPNADRDHQLMIPINQETYLMSNMVPQAPDNNQGPWADLENYLRSLTDAGNELFIVSGPLGIGGTGSSGFRTTIANGHVTVPAFTWKVVLVLPHGVVDPNQVTASAHTFAVIMPNTNGIRNDDWRIYKTSVKNIEAQTGYNIYSNVSEAVQNSIENGICDSQACNGLNDSPNPPGTANQTIADAEDTAVHFTLNAVNSISGGLTVTASQPARGSVSCNDITCTYTPEANFNGTDGFTFSVNNGQKTSNTSTATINVAAVNDPPTANGQSLSTFEDTATAITLTGSDVETASGALTFTVTQGPLYGTLSGTAPNLTYMPGPNYNGPDSFKFTVTDTGDGPSPALTSSEATVNITVVPVNDLPLVVNDQPASYPSVQYRDPIQPITFTASDIETPPGSLVPSEVFTKDGGPAQAGLPAGLSLVQTSTLGVWSLSGNIQAAAGSYAVNVTFADGDGGTASSTVTINVTKEDASLALSGPPAVQVSSVGGTSPAFTLKAAISEAPDGALGDLANATPVTFRLTPVGSDGSTFSCTTSVVTFPSGVPTAACTFSNVAVNVYDVAAEIGGGYYQGSGKSAVAVFDPSLGFVTGSGSITRTVGDETFTADFSVNLKYKKDGAAQGSFAYTEHHASGDVRFESSSMGALAVVGNDAKIIGAGMLDGLENESFIARFTDMGEQGRNDTLGLRITDANGNIVADLSFDPVKLTTGNIQVH